MNAGQTIKLHLGVAVGLVAVLFAIARAPSPYDVVSEEKSFIITESSSPAFTVGDLHAADEDLFLAEGDAIKVLTEQGLEGRIVGPYSGKIVISDDVAPASRRAMMWRAFLGRDGGVEIMAAAR